MGRLVAVSIMAALTTLSFAATPPVSAAVTVGNDCFASELLEASTTFQLGSGAGNPLPVTTPVGVVTGWTVKSDLPGTRDETFKVLRASPAAGEFTVVGESSKQVTAAGINAYDTRIPVQAGDRIGLYSSSGVPVCPGEPADSLAVFYGEVPMGSSEVFNKSNGRVAVLAEIEPDVDGDGYGDETQDLCLRSGAVRAVCPPLSLEAVAERPGRSSLVVLVATSTEAPIGVSGTARRFSLTAPPVTVAPGAIAKFRLSFTKALRSRLARLPRAKSLTLTVTAHGTDVAGIPAADTLRVKLRGRRRP
jgi:hypothetical protein